VCVCVCVSGALCSGKTLLHNTLSFSRRTHSEPPSRLPFSLSLIVSSVAMRPFTTGLHLPSLRHAVQREGRPQHGTPQRHTVSIPYPLGQSTLQVSGIHVRLGPPPKGGNASSKRAVSAKTPSAREEKEEKDAVQQRQAVCATIVVHAHIGGELTSKPRSYVVAVLPVCYNGGEVADADGGSSSSTSSSLPPSKEGARPYDKRVLNAQAREAKRGLPATLSSCAVAKLDLRAQMEKVHLCK